MTGHRAPKVALDDIGPLLPLLVNLDLLFFELNLLHQLLLPVLRALEPGEHEVVVSSIHLYYRD